MNLYGKSRGSYSRLEQNPTPGASLRQAISGLCASGFSRNTLSLLPSGQMEGVFLGGHTASFSEWVSDMSCRKFLEIGTEASGLFTLFLPYPNY